MKKHLRSEFKQSIYGRKKHHSKEYYLLINLASGRSLNLPNSCFPTRPHQDLSNNGFKFFNNNIFIQLSKKTKNPRARSRKFNSKQFLEKTYNYGSYENEIAKSVNNKKKWIIPSALKPGKFS